MNRTLKHAIHKAWEAAHRQGEATATNAQLCFDLADENEAQQAVGHQTRSGISQPLMQSSLQGLGENGAQKAIEKAPEIPSAVRTEKTLPRALDSR